MPTRFDELYPLLAGGDTRAMHEIGPLAFVLLLCTSLAGSWFIAYLYEQFFARRGTGSRIHRAFALIGPSITAIFICIEFSLPLSLGLLGALTLVRFRTPIKEPEEIGFIMLVVANAIACASYRLAYLGVLLMLAVIAGWSIVSRRLQARLPDGLMIVTLPAGTDSERSAIASLLQEGPAQEHLQSVSTQDAECVLAYRFRGPTPPALMALQSRIAAHNATARVVVGGAGLP